MYIGVQKWVQLYKNMVPVVQKVKVKWYTNMVLVLQMYGSLCAEIEAQWYERAGLAIQR